MRYLVFVISRISTNSYFMVTNQRLSNQRLQIKLNVAVESESESETLSFSVS